MYTGRALSVDKCSSNKLGENMAVPNESPFIERILACLTDGVITIDSSDLITTWNPATVNILLLEPSLALGRRYQEVFGNYSQLGLIGILNMARIQRSSGTVQTSVEGVLPGRGPVSLDLCIGVLTDSRLDYLGMFLVIDDRTSLESRK